MIRVLKILGLIIFIGCLALQERLELEERLINIISSLGVMLFLLGSLFKAKGFYENKVEGNDPNVYLYRRSFLGVGVYLKFVVLLFLAYRTEPSSIKYFLLILIITSLIEPIAQQLTNNFNVRILDNEIIVSENIITQIDLEKIRNIEVSLGGKRFKLYFQNEKKVILDARRIGRKDRTRFMEDLTNLFQSNQIEMKDV